MSAYDNDPRVSFNDTEVEVDRRDGTWHVALRHDGWWVAIPPIDESDDGTTWREVRVEFPLTEASLNLYGGAIGRCPRYRSMDSAIYGVVGDPQ